MQKLTKDHPLLKQKLKELEQDYLDKKLKIIKTARQELIANEEFIAEKEKDTLRYFGITAYADRTRRDRA